MNYIGAYEGGNVWQTKAGNNIAAPTVDGRDTKITENADGTYNVTVTHNGQVEYNKTLSETQLVKDFRADVKALGLDASGTNNTQQAQQKYGNQVANKFYSVA